MKRIQRRRTKGWRMPEGAVYVGRPTLWGNPFDLDDVRAMYPEVPVPERAALAVRIYRRELEHFGLLSDYAYFTSDATWDAMSKRIEASGAQSMAEYAAITLRGHDLACWCPLCPAHADGLPLGVSCPDCPPCHADFLLTLANPAVLLTGTLL